MAFVLLLLLSITTLVQVETSIAETGKFEKSAKLNALLALNEAIGALQAEMGPDQRISAPADIIDAAVEHPYMVGVWDSSGDRNNETVEERIQDRWEIGDGIDYNSRVQNGFRRWLISTSDDIDATDVQSMNLANNTTLRDDTVNAFKAIGLGTLQLDFEATSTAALTRKEIWAPLRTVDEGARHTGKMGWVVLDEGVKAKIGQTLTLIDPNVTGTDQEKMMAWDNPGNWGFEALTDFGFAAFDRASLDLAKIQTSRDASIFLAGNSSVSAAQFGELHHDLTIHSSGVIADVVNGGLKLDLSTLGEEQPSDYMNRRLYSDGGSPYSGVESDPHWSALIDYYTLYNNDTKLVSNALNAMPRVRTTTSNWVPGDRADLDSPLQSPEEFRLAPAVAQFETYFSFIALKPHSPSNGSGFTKNDSSSNYPADGLFGFDVNGVRQLYMGVTPVITLYNPYNVPLEFDELWVVVRDLPVGMKLFRYDHSDPDNVGAAKPMTTEFVPLASMAMARHVNNNQGNKRELAFSFKLTGSNGGTAVFAPGESIVFSPTSADFPTVEKLWNAHAAEQYNLRSEPGYNTGFGLYWDWFVTNRGSPTNWMNTNPADFVNITGTTSSGTVETISLPPSLGYNSQAIIRGDSLKIAMKLVDGTKNADGESDDGANDQNRGTFPIELYSQDPRLDKNKQDLSDDAAMIGRYVFDYNTGSIESTSMDDRIDNLTLGVGLDHGDYDSNDGIVVRDQLSYDDMDTTVTDTLYDATLDQQFPTTFAVFRVGSKITKRPTNDLPFHPSMGWVHSNPTGLNGHYHLGEEPSAFKAYDMSLVEATSGPNIDNENHGAFASGYEESGSGSAGSKYATHFEVPVTPLQSIASLQHANLAGSGYLPRVNYVVGNSWAHPMIPADGVSVTGNTVAGYELIDHSYVSNFRLWDRFYFSTLSDQGSVAFGGANANDYADSVQGLINRETALNPSLKYYQSEGPSWNASDDLLSGNTVAPSAYRKAAAYQTLDGAFNINSTSVEAWQAVLASSNIANTLIRLPSYYQPLGANDQFEFLDGTGTVAAAFSRFRIPNFNESFEDTKDDNSQFSGSLPSKQQLGIWQGFRVLNEIELRALAQQIVVEVRNRGPFLSMSEFVNRRLAVATDARSEMGTLDAAIAATNLNTTVTDVVGDDIEGDILAYINDNDNGMVQNTAALEGNTARGVPSFLTQADILQQVGSRLTARSDTFVVRAYGDVRDINGEVVSRHICEAVVQRFPDYVDSEQSPYHDGDTATAEPGGLSEINERFGRKFKVVQFRWLAPEEV